MKQLTIAKAIKDGSFSAPPVLQTDGLFNHDHFSPEDGESVDDGEEQDVITKLPMSKTTDRPPPRPLSKDDYRPLTASSKRLSLTSWVSKRSIKYGKGRFARVELIPQPSDDPEDPLVSCTLASWNHVR